ncbi:MAG: hypothetical protein MSJ26_02005 [Oscillospiraceae bacterium]|nr:hypothetical protein [Oscillospiraceae bacterium]
MSERLMSENIYGDIIMRTHHVSPVRTPMARLNRAAQFAPFAALSGYDDAVRETERLTDSRREPDEDGISDINMKLGFLRECGGFPEIGVEYFVPDGKKSGGAYVTLTGRFRRIDEYSGRLVFCGGGEIPIGDIYRIDLWAGGSKMFDY